MTDAFFELSPGVDDTYSPTPHARGPWSPEHLHGGPPAALLARAIEARAPEGFVVVRMTLELLRPVPFGALRTAVELEERGRNVRRARGRLVDAEDRVLIEASALLFAQDEVPLPSLAQERAPRGPMEAERFLFPFFRESVGYHTAMDLRYAKGSFGQSPVLAWLKMLVPLIAGEEPSPLVRVAIAADSGNGVSPVLDTERYTFINPDLSIYVTRPARGEWVGLEAHTVADTRGVGLADTRLWDVEGPIGRAAQSLLVRARA